MTPRSIACRSFARSALPLLALLSARHAEGQARGDARGPDAAAFRAAAEYSRRNNGDAVLVARGREIVFEAYQNGYAAARPHLLASGTKSFACVLAAAAIEDGLISGWDEPAHRALPEWRDDPPKNRITVRHLLDLSSGLDPAQRRLQGRGEANRNLAALRVDVLSEPGTRFRYGPSHYYAFGELMRRRLEPRGESVLGYLERRVFGPIGMTVARWARDDAGNPNLPGGAFATAREWAKFGMLLRDGGRWNGRPVLREDLLRECTRPSAANPGYGLTLWLSPDAGLEEALAADRRVRGVRSRRPSPWTNAGRGGENAGVYMAAGAGQQRMYVIPRHGLVVVRLGRRSAGWNDAEFLDLVLGRR